MKILIYTTHYTHILNHFNKVCSAGK